jgi:lipoprotein NlpD
MTTTDFPSPSATRVRAFALVAALALVAGCATRAPAPISDRAAVPPRAASATPAASTPARPVVPAPAVAEPDWRPPTYTVKRGDTLFQVALEHGLDYKDLVAWNAIENPNLIRVGQVLRLTAPGSEPPATAGAAGTTTAPLRAAPPVVAGAPGPAAPATNAATATPARPGDGALRTSPRAIKEPYSEQALRDVARGAAQEPVVVARAPDTAPRVAPVTTPSAATPAPVVPAPPTASAPAPSSGSSPGPSPGDDEGLDWVWPAKGKLVAQFSETANLKGIDIAGSAGDPVLASAPGRVVYAGTGLRGYGKLVIVKHNNTYLTAYAHNREILVKEGQNVTRGQKIAEMGSTDAEQVKLHFEIRRLGRPMDPLRFLPPA